MANGPTSVPDFKRAIAIPPEQLVGLALLASTVSAGVVIDADSALRCIGRIAAIYGFLTVAFRLIGKRELSSLSPLELITLMLIPEIASGTLNDQSPLWSALTGIGALLLLVFVVSLLSARFKAVEQAIEPPARVLVSDGRLCRDAMVRERITADELLAEMHKHGIAELSDVRWAILESGGDIAFIPRKGSSITDATKHRVRNE